MSKGGHLLTTTALACVVYAHGQDPVLAGGIVLGSSLPDVGEGVVGYFLGRRISLLVHRTMLLILARAQWLPSLRPLH